MMNETIRNYQKRWAKTVKGRKSLRKASKKYLIQRRAFIQNAKDKPCADCGIQYLPFVMDFDHVRGKKKFAISRPISLSLKRLEKEIAKCDLVCANCHRIRTFMKLHKNMWKEPRCA